MDSFSDKYRSTPYKKYESGKGRTRNFATVVYPESCPDNWLSIIDELCIPTFISPLHDKDVLPNGEPKKAHYHVMMMYDGVKTSDQAREVFQMFGGVGCEIVQSIRGYARYLCHLDSPDKVQYSVEDVRCLGGADYHDKIGLALDKYKAIREMIEFCDDNSITNYSELLEFCAFNRPDWFRVLCDNGTYVISHYLKHKIKQ